MESGYAWRSIAVRRSGPQTVANPGRQADISTTLKYVQSSMENQRTAMVEAEILGRR
jgi:hypothetical protein